MNEGFIGDLMMLQPQGGSDPHLLLQRQNEVLRDLSFLARKLANLSYGELRATWTVRFDTWWLHLELVPRRQGLLFDPLSRGCSRAASLREEAMLVRKEIAESPLRAQLAAAAFKRWVESEVPEPLHEDHEMASRRSRSQWIMESESGQLCLVFPETPRYKVDSAPCQVSGTTAWVSMHAIELTQLACTEFEGNSGGRLGRLARLRVIPSVNSDATKRRLPWTLATQVRPGDRLVLVVTLQRCVLSNRVVGAVLSE